MRLRQAMPITILPLVLGILGAVWSQEPTPVSGTRSFNGMGTFNGTMQTSGGSRSNVEFQLREKSPSELVGELTKIGEGKSWEIWDGYLKEDSLVFSVGGAPGARCTLIRSSADGAFEGPCCKSDGGDCPITLTLEPRMEVEIGGEVDSTGK